MSARRIALVAMLVAGACSPIADPASEPEEEAALELEDPAYDARWSDFWLNAAWRRKLPQTQACGAAVKTCEQWAYHSGQRQIGCLGRVTGDVYCDSMVKGCIADRDLTGVWRSGKPELDHDDPCGVAEFFTKFPKAQSSPKACRESGKQWRKRDAYRHPYTDATSPSDACTTAPDGMFRDCCLQHDRGWLTCDDGYTTRKTANDTFLACMRGSCDSALMSDGDTAACYASAQTYWAAVSWLATKYDDTQRIACQCR